MDQGLAHQMVYGSGENQNTRHFYAGANPVKGKKKKKNCRKSIKITKKIKK